MRLCVRRNRLGGSFKQPKGLSHSLPSPHSPNACALPLRSKGLPVALDISVPNRVPSSTEELRHMEAAHQVGVCLWFVCVWCGEQDMLETLLLP